MNKSRFSYLFPIIAVATIFWAAAAIIFFRTADFVKNGAKTEAVITKIDGHYDGDDYEHDVFVRFSVDGTDYYGELNAYEAGFRVGKSVPIIYKTENPNDFIYGKRNAFISVLLFAVGAFLFFIALKAPVSALFGKISLAIKKRDGKEVEATVTRVETSEAKGLISKFSAVVSFLGDDGAFYEKKFGYFNSDLIHVGSKVRLYVDYYNADKFAVDFRQDLCRDEKG